MSADDPGNNHGGVLACKQMSRRVTYVSRIELSSEKTVSQLVSTESVSVRETQSRNPVVLSVVLRTRLLIWLVVVR